MEADNFLSWEPWATHIPGLSAIPGGELNMALSCGREFEDENAVHISIREAGIPFPGDPFRNNCLA